MSDDEIEGNHWGVEETGEDDPEVSVSEDSNKTNDTDTTQQGGLSPVVGMILMVVVTVIIAAVVGTFVLDLAASMDQSPNEPSVTVEKDTTTDEIILTVESIPENYKYVTVEGPNTKSQIMSGQTFTFEEPPENASITVTGTYETAGGLYTEGETHTHLLYDAEITLEDGG